jgi:tripartite-type tricarboxylate transporter receptor subunit TctC
MNLISRIKLKLRTEEHPMTRFSRILLAFMGFCASTAAMAQDWPSKPIRLILPVTAGNVNDLAARIIADKLSTIYGHRVVVENYAGAGGILGMNKLLTAAPDGYTFGFLPGSTVMITPLLYKDAGYTVNDIVPVAPVGEVPYIIAVSPRSGISSLEELIERAKAAPGKLKFASQFIGSGAHLIAERFAADMGIKFTMIPYRGVTEAVTSVVNGETQVTMQAVSTMAELVKAGQLKAFAVTSKERLPGWADLPTTSEKLPNSDATAWFGIFAVKGTSQPIIDKLAQDIDTAVRSPDVVKRFEVGGIYPVNGRQKELAAKVTLETLIFSKIVKEADIKVQ